ncbi:MAG: biotin--[acetyl-CoA-carboxylase] ligase [Rhodobacter sp.]|nr:biotin--[acetyl-CoA-carboxylase] ligase [Rhodobacter sp.]
MSFWPDGYDRIVLDETDNTMAEAARRAPHLAGPTWIFARHQTAARGRRGRIWVNPAGNFSATLVLRPAEPPETVALRSFVAALALYDAIARVTGRPGLLSLKWPNDVLVNGGKVAGILLESSGQGRVIRHLAIGIGVNLARAPDAGAVEQGATPPVSLAEEAGLQIGPEEFLAELAAAYAGWETRFSTYGFAPLREAWLDRAARLGQVITARTGAEEIAGVFETVDKSGALVLNTANGRRAIPAADVYF